MKTRICIKNSTYILQPVRFFRFFEHSNEKEREHSARKLIG